MELPQKQKTFIQSIVLQHKLEEEENKLKKEEKKDELILLKIIKKQQEESQIPLAGDLILSSKFFKETFFDKIDNLQRDIDFIQKTIDRDPKDANSLISERTFYQEDLIKYARNSINAIVKRYDEKQQLRKVKNRFGEKSLELLQATVKYNNQERERQNLPPITEIQQIEQSRLIEEQKQDLLQETEPIPTQEIIKEKVFLPKTQPIAAEERPVQQPKRPSYIDRFYQATIYVFEGIKSFFKSIFNLFFPQY